MNLFRKLNFEMNIFQQYFTPPPHPWKQAWPKPPWVPSTPIIPARSTFHISKSFQSYGYIKKYADSGSTVPRLLRLCVRIPPGAWMSVFYECRVFRRLLLAPVQLPSGKKMLVRVPLTAHFFRAFFLGGRGGMRTPKNFMNLTGENQLHTYYGFLCDVLSFM